MWRERAACQFQQLTSWLWGRYLTFRHPGLQLGRGVRIEGPLYIRLAPGSTIKIGEGAWLRHHAELLVDGGHLTIGKGSYIGAYSVLNCQQHLVIGDHCLLAEFVTVRDVEHAYQDPGLPIAFQGYTHRPTEVGSGCWLGAKATVTAGVTLGPQCVVGANAVVTKDLAAGSVAVGSPAKPLTRNGP